MAENQIEHIMIATVKSWNLENAARFMRNNSEKYNVTLVSDHDTFIAEVAGKENIWIFFPHWNWIVPQHVWEKNRCVAFHTGDLPHGRGGSPIQNLIMRKIYETQLTAFRMDGGIDAGPIYMKRPFSLRDGNVEDILRRASKIIFEEMIPYILRANTPPVMQVGDRVLEFKRRTPDDSNLNFAGGNIEDIYDFIRMLDGEGYPGAFLNFGARYGGRKILLSNARLIDRKIVGRF